MGSIKIGKTEYRSKRLYLKCGYNGGMVSVGTNSDYGGQPTGSKVIIFSMGSILYQLTGKNVQVENLRSNSLAVLEGRVGHSNAVNTWLDGSLPNACRCSQVRKVSPVKFNSTVADVKASLRVGKPIMRNRVVISGYFQEIVYEIDNSGSGEILLDGEILAVNCQDLIIKGSIEYSLSCRSLYVKDIGR